MRLVLVGADYEENLGMCMIAAAADSAGHRTSVVPFQSSEERSLVVERVLAARPDVVGLAAQFQHRGMDYLGLACDLRRAGFRGHITAGGQFATMAQAPILSGRYGVDSVVLYEGERTIAELLDAVASGGALGSVAGLALPDGKGGAYRTAPRALASNLDCLPLAQRYRQHSRQLGVPFIPVSGSRGCWAECSFCSITTVLRDGREHDVLGRRLRLRSPEDVGLEMAMLAQAVGGSAIFCFHDENFLLPRPADSLARVAAMRKTLDEQGVGPSALVGKCRPDTMTKDLAAELARLGVIRMYVGVENASPNGATHLNRRTDVSTMAAAIDACAVAGIYACYNLLIFEPESTLDDVAQNIAFMRKHASTPVNFCRAEPYLGTPMQRRLQAAGKLRGGFLGWDYRIEDDRTELLFRMAASAFREHNFASAGVANRYMSLGYSAKVLDFFYKDATGRKASLMERALEITRSITLDTSELLEAALDIAAHIDLADHDRIARQTALLGLRVAASDRIWYAAMDALEKDMARFARGEAQAGRKTASRTVRVAQGAAMAGWLALWATGATSCGRTGVGSGRDAGALDGKRDSSVAPDGTLVMDPLPPPADARTEGPLVVDMAPPPADARTDGPLVVDALPPDSGPRRDTQVFDPLPPDANPRDLVPDATPIDTGTGDVRDAAKEGPLVVDMAPPPADARDLPREYSYPDADIPPDASARDAGTDARDAGTNEPPFMVDPVVDARLGLRIPLDMPGGGDAATREHWANTAPVRMKRSEDLPLCLCPELRLAGEWQGGKILAHLSGVSGTFGVRWQAQGQVDGDGDEVLWTPSSDEDQLDVAVRTRDGVAVTSLRLGNASGRKEA
jgi:anaerobic magnesium-protoporphyrin IX monomethyl ester cyclase